MRNPIIPISRRDAAFIEDTLRAVLKSMEAAPQLFNATTYKRLHMVVGRLNARQAAVRPKRGPKATPELVEKFIDDGWPK